jgi:predicted permease
MSGRFLFYLRSAVRSLRRTPVLSLAAVLSLALGIGANAAIFSFFNHALLKRLPVQQPEQLVTFTAPGPKQGRTSSSSIIGGSDAVFSYPLFRDLERGQQALTGIAAHRLMSANIAHRGRTSNETAMLVSGSYFPVLGLKPALGRLLTQDDDRALGAHRVVVLSHAYWRSRFGENPSILNESIVVNGESMTVVGVAPRGFQGTTSDEPPRVFLPLTMSAAIHSDWEDLSNRRDHWLYLIGRLKPGMSRDAAQASINGLFSGILQNLELPQLTGRLTTERGRAEFLARKIVLADGARGEQPNRGELIPVYTLMFSITGIVVLIACANIANLLLARGVSRAPEFAVRLSLGASRSQLMAQLMIESCMLALLGGAGGLFVARWIADVLRAARPDAGETFLPFQIDAALLVFAFGLSLVTALVFGMLPAIHSTRVHVTTMARTQGGVTPGTSSRLRSALVTAQIALALALLVVAGLFAKSLVNIGRIDLGMQTSNVTTFRVSPALNGYSAERSLALFEQITAELEALHGVTSVTESTIPLIEGSDASANVSVRGFEALPDADLDSNLSLIGPRFFATLGVPLIAGREFNRADASTSQHVAIVNEAFTRKFKVARDAAIGTRMELGKNDTPKFDIEIVGLVQDTKYSDAKQDPPPVFFLPYRQRDDVRAINYYVRSTLDTANMNSAVTGILAKLDPNLPVEELRTLDAQVRDSASSDRLLAQIAIGFGLLSTLLAAIGLYGVLAYSVAQRTPEIGVRLALGADGARIRQMILRYVGRLTLVGMAVGLAAAVILGRFAASLLFRVESTDASVMLAAVTAVILVAVTAAMLPAYRASRIDPARALRWE